MSKLRLRIFDGGRQLFGAPANFLVRIVDGNQQQQFWDTRREPVTDFELPFFDNFGDRYTVVVSSPGYRQAGYFPVLLSSRYRTTLDLMLIRDDPGFSFVSARWPAVRSAFPFLAQGADDVAGERRYDDLLDRSPMSLACLLNLIEVMREIALPQSTPLDYLRALRWDPPHAPAPDRLFAWCDLELIEQVKRSAAEGRFAEVPAPSLLHPGATRSWKQVQFGEANLQLTFHENDTATIDGTACVLLEPDIDYFCDLAAHIILEVVPHALTHTLTDPVQVYVLRWIAGQTAGIPEFRPLYTLT